MKEPEETFLQPTTTAVINSIDRYDNRVIDIHMG